MGMKRFVGIGVCGGVAFGRVHLLQRESAEVVKRTVDRTEEELARLEAAKRRAIDALSAIGQEAARAVGDADAEIFEIHAMMVEDEDYNESIRRIIEEERVNAEYAVSVAGERLATSFEEMDDAYMRARAADIRAVTERILAGFSGERVCKIEIPYEHSVICADDLSPAETVSLDKTRVEAFVTAQGSQSSHTAILARSLGIPAIVGVGESLLRAVRDGEEIAVDGHRGEAFLLPDEAVRERLLRRQRQDAEEHSMLERLKGKENVTADGRRIRIYANIGDVGQIDEALAQDAGGIGLFRSEFLFLDRRDLPSEEEQTRAYRELLLRMEGRRVIVRTLDVGADKQTNAIALPSEENPALGVRGARLYRWHPHLIRTQLRALLRASVEGRLGIMFPMITSTGEVEALLRLWEEIAEELGREGYPVSDRIERGIMIETPAAALISDRLAERVDFFSIGTNDLTQYTLACDRQNPRVAEECDPHHEAILRLIGMTVQNAHRCGAWVGICGELAADAELTRRFLEMEIDELSVTPSEILRLRKRVREIDLGGDGRDR